MSGITLAGASLSRSPLSKHRSPQGSISSSSTGITGLSGSPTSVVRTESFDTVSAPTAARSRRWSSSDRESKEDASTDSCPDLVLERAVLGTIEDIRPIPVNETKKVLETKLSELCSELPMVRMVVDFIFLRRTEPETKSIEMGKLESALKNVEDTLKDYSDRLCATVKQQEAPEDKVAICIENRSELMEMMRIEVNVALEKSVPFTIGCYGVERTAFSDHNTVIHVNHSDGYEGVYFTSDFIESELKRNEALTRE
jgi:hypothetical protein